MTELTDAVRAAALAHATAEMPREACGLVIVERGRQIYVPCRNMAEGDDQFALAPEDYAAAEDRGEVVAVVHSHPNASANPSEADRVACEASGLPWWIVGVPSGVWRPLQPCGYRAPLVGREFVHGILDCYALIRDYYAEQLHTPLPDFSRADGWWDRGQNLYLDNFATAGFVEVPLAELREHDVVLMQVMAPVPNHAGVYLGHNVILHHLHGRLSSRDVFGGFFLKNATHALRHRTRL